MTSPVFVAVYGSLRRKMGNHGVNLRAGAEVVDLGMTCQDYSLFNYCGTDNVNAGAFPSVSLAHPRNPIRVEVYRTTQEGLEGAYDCLEGCYGHNDQRNFYNRTLVPVLLDSGEQVECWIYHIDNDYPERVVDSGDWSVFKNGSDYYETL